MVFSGVVNCRLLFIRNGPDKNDSNNGKWSVNAFYCVNGLHVGSCILCVKMRTFLCEESTVAA